MSNNNPYGFRWLTLNNARALNKLITAQVRAEQRAGNTSVTNNRQNRRNARNSERASGNVTRFSKSLQNRYGITNMNVFNNYTKYNSTIPGITNRTLLAGHLSNALRVPLTGTKYWYNMHRTSRNKINEMIARYVANGLSQSNATRKALQAMFSTGARTAAAVRTIQRKFRQKRAQKGLENVHRQLLRFVSISPVPFPGMTRSNAGYYIRPSNIKRAPAYLASQGVRIVERPLKRARTI
jgi:hypothetical protein